MTQLRKNEKDGLERIAALAATESATIPGLSCGDGKYAGGYANANKFLQMEEWAFQQYFAGAIIDEETSQALEYRDLIKHPKHKNIWLTSLANELGRLS